MTLNFLPFTGTAAKTAPAPGLATYYTTEPLAFSPKYAIETIYTQLDSYVTYADGPKC